MTLVLDDFMYILPFIFFKVEVLCLILWCCSSGISYFVTTV